MHDTMVVVYGDRASLYSLFPIISPESVSWPQSTSLKWGCFMREVAWMNGSVAIRTKAYPLHFFFPKKPTTSH